MRRIFGAPAPAKATAPPPTLDDASKRLELRQSELENKIRKCDEELRNFGVQLKNTRSPAGQRVIKNKARRVLQQRKMFESQLDQLLQQSFNMDQTRFNVESMRDTATTVSAMKHASEAMRSQMKELNIDHVEDLYDDMQDLMDQQQEMQEAMSRSYAVPDDYDDMDLDAELDALGSDLGEPSYLSALEPSSSSMSADPFAGFAVDEYGLPTVPSTAPAATETPTMGF